MNLDNAFLPHDAFDALCSTPQGIQWLYNMMQSMEPNVEIQNSSEKNYQKMICVA